MSTIGAGPRLRRYIMPSVTTHHARYPTSDAEHVVSAANQRHYLITQDLVGLHAEHRVLDCAALMRKALFDEMTMAARQRLSQAATPHEEMDRMCQYQLVRSIVLKVKVLDADLNIIEPPSALDQWRRLSWRVGLKTATLHHDVVLVEGKLESERTQAVIFDVFHYGIVELPGPIDTVERFFGLPVADHHLRSSVGFHLLG